LEVLKWVIILELILVLLQQKLFFWV
jgi:hypothetical protein